MDDEHKKEHPEQAASLQKGREEEAQEEEHPQDETENELFDTSQHSDAPGPFGTG
jgi:hypothetical protein